METSPVTLYDIKLRSLAGADTRRVASKLAALKLAESAQEALALVSEPPAILARYVAEDAASSVCSSLKNIGTDVVVLESHLTCPHCSFQVPCRGTLSESGRGAVFACPQCAGQTLLDSRDHRFHPLLRCKSCDALVNLPASPKPGGYRCKCGQVLRYEPSQEMGETSSPAEPPIPVSRVSPHAAVLSVALLFVVVVATSVLPIPGLKLRWGYMQEAARSAPKARHTLAYRTFTGGTGRAGIITVMGQPQAESASEDGAYHVMFYRLYDLYIILEKTGDASISGGSYLGSVRISDEAILHERPPM